MPPKSEPVAGGALGAVPIASSRRGGPERTGSGTLPAGSVDSNGGGALGGGNGGGGGGGGGSSGSGGQGVTGPPQRVTTEEVQHVQGLIEQCMTAFMPQHQIASLISSEEGVEPALVAMVWQKLEDLHPAFFAEYHARSKLKEQIVMFNYLLEQQVSMVNKLYSGWMSAMPPMPPPPFAFPGAAGGMGMRMPGPTGTAAAAAAAAGMSASGAAAVAGAPAAPVVLGATGTVAPAAAAGVAATALAAEDDLFGDGALDLGGDLSLLHLHSSMEDLMDGFVLPDVVGVVGGGGGAGGCADGAAAPAPAVPPLSCAGGGGASDGGAQEAAPLAAGGGAEGVHAGSAAAPGVGGHARMHGGVASGAGGGGGGDALLVLGGSGPSDHDMGHDMGLPSDEALVQAPLAGMGIDVDDVDDMRGLLAGDGPPPAGMDALEFV